MPAVTESKYLVMAGWNDVPHLSEQTKRELLASTPAHQRDARSKGIPVLGSGKIFPIDEEIIKEDPINIPAHWPRICGMDFGWDHPTAMGWLAWDRDTDTVHLYDCHRESEKTPMHHAGIWRAKGKWIPVAWPHDGLNTEKGTGESLATQYRAQGVLMLKDKATHPPPPLHPEGTGGNSVETGLLDMLERMTTGRFKVARHLEPFFEEMRLYHREKGVIIKKFDDLISAVRYGIMMLRFAKVNDTLTKKAVVTGHVPHDSDMGY